MNRLTNKERVQILRSLVEGNSIRGTVRITGFAKIQPLKLLADVGAACLEILLDTGRSGRIDGYSHC